MDQFFEFVVNNWTLWLLFVVIVIMIFFNEFVTKVRGVAQLSPTEVVNLMNSKDAVVVDIRDHSLFTEGHILGAVSLPKSDIATNTKVLNKHRDKPLIVACAQGQSAVAAAKNLSKAGIENLHILKGGMSAWLAASMPVEKGK